MFRRKQVLAERLAYAVSKDSVCSLDSKVLQQASAAAVTGLLSDYVKHACFRYFYATVQLGTPPREFAVIVDTGSTVTYVPCASCGTGCGEHHKVSLTP